MYLLDMAPGASGPASIVHRADPALRIVLASGFACAVVSLQTFAALLLALVLAITTLVVSGVGVGTTLKRMVAMDTFIVFMLLTLPFTVAGTPAFQVLGLTASTEGLHLAFRIVLKANAIVLMLLTMVGSMESVMFGHALARLSVPQNLVNLLMFTVRYIDVLQDEYLRLRTAMRARGFQPDNSRHTYRTFGYVVGMLLIRAVERSERILDAMKCRGFAGKIHMLDERSWTPLDTRLAVFATGAVGLVLTVEWW
ncbi:MAG: cobalt ECF transporter T component CbiQ [Pseudomonadota bacterium]